jgi:hypothetical protein
MDKQTDLNDALHRSSNRVNEKLVSVASRLAETGELESADEPEPKAAPPDR